MHAKVLIKNEKYYYSNENYAIGVACQNSNNTLKSICLPVR